MPRGDGGQPSLAAGAHADWIEFQRGHAVVMHQLPQFRQVLDQRRDDLLGRADVGQRIGDDESLEAGQSLERDLRDLLLVQLLDVDAAPMG
jgi:hypothetical protein